jgi:hypothetical protein
MKPFRLLLGFAIGVCTENLNPDVMVMEAAQDRL